MVDVLVNGRAIVIENPVQVIGREVLPAPKVPPATLDELEGPVFERLQERKSPLVSSIA